MNFKLITTAACFFLAAVSLNVNAATIFTDDFSSGNTTGLTFYGSNSSNWSAASGRLIHNAPLGYTGLPEFALFNGITTPDRFTIAADVSIISSINGSDWGHIGFAWGVNDLSQPFQSFNTSYLRSHQDRVTNWSIVNGSTAVEKYLNTPGATNSLTYRFSVEVDYLARIMTTSLGGFSTTFSGADFDIINQNVGGGIGLISWNDNIAFDNVVLSTPSTVPVPAAFWLFGSALLGLFGITKRRKHRLY